MRRLENSVKKEVIPVLLRRFVFLQLPLAHASHSALEDETAYFTGCLASYLLAQSYPRLSDFGITITHGRSR